MNETMGTLTIVAYRNKGTYGNVSVFFYAQNLEAQQGLDYNTSKTVSRAQSPVELKILCPYICAVNDYRINIWMGCFSLFITTPLSIQMLLFVHGERHKYVDVQIINDAIPEGAERFQLILSKPSSGVELGTNTTGTTEKHQLNSELCMMASCHNIHNHICDQLNLVIAS